MKNIRERQRDILSIISKLDISPTMFRNAEEKYKAITAFLSECGIDAEMYPQGSFAFGTVVRPNTKDPSANYDLDFICQVNDGRESCAPSDLRRQIENALNSNDTYKSRLVVYEECFTIEYADINGIGFTIDIVPAVDESQENKVRLAKSSQFSELIDTSIAVPKHNGEKNYSWLTNNPRGFKLWFDKINAPFLDAARSNYRQRLFEEHRAIYNSVEDIPRELERSALQRVIQILKYHRDVYYSHFIDGDDVKPISAIINTVVARISSEYNNSLNSVFDLLKYVLDELDIYAERQRLTEGEFTQHFGNRSVFSKKEGKWYICNPANPEDNLANKWNENNKIPELFFRWVHSVRTDIIEALQLDENQQFRSALENGFGRTAVNSVLGQKYCNADTQAKMITPQKAPKPYCNL